MKSILFALLIFLTVAKLFWGFYTKLTKYTYSNYLVSSVPFLGAFVYDEDSYYFHYQLNLNTDAGSMARKVDIDYLREASYIPWTSHLALYHAVATIDLQKALGVVAYFTCRSSKKIHSFELVAKRVGVKDEEVGSSTVGRINCK